MSSERTANHTAKRSTKHMAKHGHHPQLIHKQGPLFFTSRKVYQAGDQTITWESRRARKNLRPRHMPKQHSTRDLVLKSLWMPWNLNWWIGLIFAIGSAFFALGCVLVLWPSVATAWGLSANQVNATFFIGSIPFTCAAYLQLYQAANAAKTNPDHAPASDTPPKRLYIGWFPWDIGWHASITQFIGTVLFNLNTFDAMLPNLTWAQADIAVWVPNILGSILFLYSGYLIYAESVHKTFGWNPRDISWYVTSINFYGCVAFMVSAVFALSLPQPLIAEGMTISVVFTLIGAVCFFIGSLLMWPEAADTHITPDSITPEGADGAAA